ncbi:pyridoxamine 5'-phosphate oxidase family protein [Chitinivibrio alkaliphilus]|uniref:Pyridoxamine 5'-phosphate oxidase n=1 Tax=Chitinivibrio alkaliphilus ACht1 TaxID=1313304 RepID=U7D8C9_9BACT|nr:pyridoxamine 5'-phosphate oxidase family protein [Chitinivibrio alkaliphilus]ERP30685.1 Pyridoxamine 5'-phosphate oxidase [Chitinivibrio alkaliphilus ACht1]
MNELETKIAQLLATQYLGVLSTSRNGHPYASLVGFARAEHLSRILFATHRATRKYANIQGDTRVSLLIDSRTNQVEDFRSAAAVTALGVAGEVGPGRYEALEKLFLERHPHLQEFVQSPGCALCEITVHRYTVVQRFQDVMELDFDHTTN